MLLPMSGSEYEYEKESVNLWLDEEQKARWESYVEESADLQYMSQLVRKAVEQEVNGSESNESPIAEGTIEQLTDAIEVIAGLDRKLEALDDRLLSIEQAVRDNPEVRDLANRVFEILPTKAEISEYEHLVSTAGSRPPENVASSAQSGALCDIAGVLDEPDHRVREALHKLQKDTHQVHTFERDDETRFYKEG